MVEQASNKNPLMAAGLIKQAAALSADVLADHERQLETAAGAIGQQAGKIDALKDAYVHSRNAVDGLTRDLITLSHLVAAIRETVAELAARSGLQFATGSGVVACAMLPEKATYEGEISNG